MVGPHRNHLHYVSNITAKHMYSSSFCLSLVCNMCTVLHGLFALPLGVIGRLCFVFVALPRHHLYQIAKVLAVVQLLVFINYGIQ